MADVELQDILAFLDIAEVGIAPVDMDVTMVAVAASDRYGRRGGHRADLNMGDCFAYAFSKQRNVVLLYKSKDFELTDVRRA